MFKTLLLVAVVAVTAMTLIGQSEQAELIDQQALLLERLEEVNHAVQLSAAAVKGAS